jgi:hypothetical protein
MQRIKNFSQFIAYFATQNIRLLPSIPLTLCGPATYTPNESEAGRNGSMREGAGVMNNET